MFPRKVKAHTCPFPGWNLLAGQHRKDNSQHQPARLNKPPSYGQQKSWFYIQPQQPQSTP